jgi:prefoldin subunit 5
LVYVQAGADGAMVGELHDQISALKSKLAELPPLRRELASTKAALAELEEALAWDTNRLADPGAPAETASELKAAWERVSLLQKRFTELQVW